MFRHLKTYEAGGTVHQYAGGFNRGYYFGVMEAKSPGLNPRFLSHPEYKPTIADISPDS